MDSKIPRVHVFSAADFRKWLEKNHDKEKIVQLVIHKRHTGKPFPTHRELMDEGICFGWIDTVIKRIDHDTFIRTFQRRNANSRWSMNTLSYARELIKNKKMTPHGLAFYHEGRKKKAFDHGIPKNPGAPEELIKALEKNKKAGDNFAALPNSVRRSYLRWLFMAKTPATRETRIKRIKTRMLEKDWRVLKF